MDWLFFIIPLYLVVFGWIVHKTVSDGDGELTFALTAGVNALLVMLGAGLSALYSKGLLHYLVYAILGAGSPFITYGLGKFIYYSTHKVLDYWYDLRLNKALKKPTQIPALKPAGEYIDVLYDSPVRRTVDEILQD